MSAQGDCEFLVQRARELVQQDLWAAKAWLITARSLYPSDFNIQVRPGGGAGGALLPASLSPPARLAQGTPGPAPGRGDGSVTLSAAGTAPRAAGQGRPPARGSGRPPSGRG